MNSLVCVNCQNKKPVNSTNNRLVTEKCGHVKCMDCLLHEKTGCLACLKKTPKEEHGDDTDEGAVGDGELAQDTSYDADKQDNQCADWSNMYEDLSVKKKPETSHIQLEPDENGGCYVCTLCKKKLQSQSQVLYHAYCNGQRKPFQCPECNKSFAVQSHYKYHMRVHRNERTYACDVCGDGFFQMSKLQRHKLKHTKEKKYACSECNKAFNNLTSLRKHGLTHTEEKPYVCSTCGRRFRDSSNLRKHIAKHEKKCTCVAGGGGGAGAGAGACGCGRCRRSRGGRRQHQCPRCPLAFHSSKDMRRHAAVHTDSKPFSCKVCNRRFRRKDNLERHIRNTHPDYVPSSAVECDEDALKQIAANGTLAPDPQQDEKTKLEIRNPLPPLPQEVIQKHMHENGNKEPSPEKIIDKSYILVANNARQSVIVEKPVNVETKNPVQECEYVHKIRKASIILPPIDVRKIMELEQHTNLNNLRLGVPPKDKKKVYEQILYDRDGDRNESEESSVDSGPGIHWRRKIKQSVSIDMQ